MSNRPVEPCRSCGYKPKDWPDLALHVIKNRETHPQASIRWALAFSSNSDYLDQKVSRQKQFEGGRIALTEEQKLAKEDSQRPLSGIEKSTFCWCPICRQNHPERIPVEFLQSNTAWKKDGKPIVDCLNCRR